MTNQTLTSTRKTGKSFNRLSNQWFLKPKKESKPRLNLAEVCAETAAQAMTIIGYGDSYKGMPFRSLHYKVECEDYQDFAACITIINQYNEFDATRILKAARWALNLRHFLNDDNGNNGKSFFKFKIGRESSPVFYVNYNDRFDRMIIKDTEEVPFGLMEGGRMIDEPGTLIYWEEYTAEDFKTNMKTLSETIGADEFDIEELNIFGDSRDYTARFWFD